MIFVNLTSKQFTTATSNTIIQSQFHPDRRCLRRRSSTTQPSSSSSSTMTFRQRRLHSLSSSITSILVVLVVALSLLRPITALQQQQQHIPTIRSTPKSWINHGSFHASAITKQTYHHHHNNNIVRTRAQLIDDRSERRRQRSRRLQQSATKSISMTQQQQQQQNGMPIVPWDISLLYQDNGVTTSSKNINENTRRWNIPTITSSTSSWISTIVSPPIDATPSMTTTTTTTSSISTGSALEMIISLIKSIVGGGVLAIPAAVASLGDSPTQVLPMAIACIVIIGSINAYYFSLMGKVCTWTNATTFSQAWERTMGTETSTLFASMISIKTLLSCISYSMIIGESFQSIAISAGMLDITQTDTLLAITGLALLPLCLMKDLSSLSPFSFAGILGFVYTGIAMTIRSLDGSYHLAPIDTIESGQYLIDIPDPFKPSFGTSGPEIQGIVLACTLATAFVSHYNAPRFHKELQNKDQFDVVTYTSFGISALLMSIIAIAGFTTFGIASAPVILNNYSPYDPMIAMGRIAIALSLVATFPFPFFGLRDSIFDALNVPSEQRMSTTNDDDDNNMKNVALTIGLLSIITGVALSVNDLSLLLSVGGGTIATAVYSVFPTIMFRKAVQNQVQQQEQRSSSTSNTDVIIPTEHQWDINVSTALMCLCVATGATGVGLAIQNHFFVH